MKMQDLIASIVDLIGHAQQPEPEEHQMILVAQPEEKPGTDSPFTNTGGDDVNRFRQIIDLVSDDPESNFSNEPNEKYADIEAVTTHAGGGVNGPKHPADIKSSTISMYPDFVARRGE